MKVAIIVMISNENLYLRNWVEYNKNLGFDNIIVVDNAPDVGGDYPQYVVGDYISDGFVIYENRRQVTPNVLCMQEITFTEMYDKYHEQFDYIGYFDVDEFLTFTPESGFKNVKEYLTSKYVMNAEQIKINWKVYNDNDLVHYDSRPVYERFINPTEPIDAPDEPSGDYPINGSSKLIINCNLTSIADFICTKSPHICTTEHIGMDDFICVNNSGRLVDFRYGVIPIDHSIAYLRHYRTLTIEEFLYRRFTRGNNDVRGVYHNKLKLIKMFASENEITEEKKEIIESFFRNAGKKYGKMKK